MKKITIIIPIYNAEKCLARCIESILHQTFTEFELLLIDDGSEDSTAKICRAYAEQDDRIQYVYQKNAGPDMARRKGVHTASCDYLMFVDADDYIAEDMLQILFDEMNAANADMVCSPTIRFNNKGEEWSEKNFTPPVFECSTTKDKFYHFFATRYITGSYIAKLIKRELLSGYKFVEQAVIGEDISAVIYMIQHAKKIRVIDKGCYYYYWNLESISHSGYTDRHKVSLLNYISLKEDLISQQYFDTKAIAGFFAEYEMAVATAMSRNKNYPKDVITILKSDLQKDKKDIMKNRYTPFYMKVCIAIFIGCPEIFFILYRMIFLLTGR